MRRRWLSLCIVCPSHSQISSLSTAILAVGKASSRREPNLGCRGADRPGWCAALPKKTPPHKSCRMSRRIVVMKLICSLGHCECDGHTARYLSQRRLTANWLGPRENDCTRMHSKVSSDCLSSYIKATRVRFSRYSKWLDTLRTHLVCILCEILEDGGTMIVCSVGNYSPSDTASQTISLGSYTWYIIFC